MAVDTANIAHIQSTIEKAAKEIRIMGSAMHDCAPPEQLRPPSRSLLILFRLLAIAALDRVYKVGIEETAARMTAPDIKVAVVGDAGTRKSSLINALLFTTEDLISMGFSQKDLADNPNPVPLPVGTGDHVTQTLVYVRRSDNWAMYKMKAGIEADRSVNFFPPLSQRAVQRDGKGETRPPAVIQLILTHLDHITDGDANLMHGWLIEGPFRIPTGFTLIDTPGWQPEFNNRHTTSAVLACLNAFFQAAPYDSLIVLSPRPNTRNNISSLLARKIITPHRKVPSLVFCWSSNTEPQKYVCLWPG